MSCQVLRAPRAKTVVFIKEKLSGVWLKPNWRLTNTTAIHKTVMEEANVRRWRHRVRHPITSTNYTQLKRKISIPSAIHRKPPDDQLGNIVITGYLKIPYYAIGIVCTEKFSQMICRCINLWDFVNKNKVNNKPTNIEEWWLVHSNKRAFTINIWL